MWKTLLSVAVLGLFVAGCGSKSAPDSKAKDGPTKTVAKPATDKGDKPKKADEEPPPKIALKKALEDVESKHDSYKGCPYVAKDQSHFACWSYELDMGFGALSLNFYSADAPGKADKIDLYARHDNDDDWKLRDEAIKKAQKRLDDGLFKEVKWLASKPKRHPAGQPVTVKGSALALPKVSADRAAECCKWMTTAHKSKDTAGALIKAYGDCDYVDKPGDACHVDDYNDESYTYKEVWFLLK